MVLLATVVPAALAASRSAAADPAIAFPNIQVLDPDQPDLDRPTDLVHAHPRLHPRHLERRSRTARDPSAVRPDDRAGHGHPGPVHPEPGRPPGPSSGRSRSSSRWCGDPPTDYRFPLTGFGTVQRRVGRRGRLAGRVQSQGRLLHDPGHLRRRRAQHHLGSRPRRDRLRRPERRARPLGRLGRRVRLHRRRQQHRHLEPAQRHLLAASPGRPRQLLHPERHQP